MAKPLTKTKALVLFSGGLDSMLAVKLLEQQGLAVSGICFFSNFFSCQQAKKSAQQLNLPLFAIDISAELLKIVKKPLSGYGRYLNPCLDCHALMFKRASQLAAEKNFSVLASGEVLGQRPFSQNRQALKKVSELAGVEVLRPLSAKLLPPTAAEKSGLVKRELLLALSGRRREQQIKLAQEFGLKNYPSPAGGCLLTEKDFSQRLGQMLNFWPKCTPPDIELLKFGRLFWFQSNNQPPILVVVGRHQADNQALEKLLQKQDYVLQLKKRPGPTAIIRGYEGPKPEAQLKFLSPAALKFKPASIISLTVGQDVFWAAAKIVAFYAPATRGQEVEVAIKSQL